MENKRQLIANLRRVSIILLGLTLFLYPIFMLTTGTEAFSLPKQALLGIAVFIVLILLGVETIILKAVKIRRTPFDTPVLFFIIAVLLSVLFALNRLDAVTAFVPALLAVSAYFAIVNNAKDKSSIFFLLSALVTGTVISSIVTIFSFFKLYIFPFEFAKQPGFTTMGSLIDQALYLILVFPIAVDLSWPFISSIFEGKKEKSTLDVAPVKKESRNFAELGFLGAAIIIFIGFAITIYNLIYVQKPVLLPFSIGFQTSFASISQDTGRILQSFLFGSGFGTYATVFAKFKSAAINLDKNIWSIVFYRSSSFILELLATTGFIGLTSFLYLVYRIIRERPVFIPLILATIAAFIVPFSYSILALLFILVALYSSLQGLKQANKYFDVELQLVALRKGLISLETPQGTTSGKSQILPYIVFALLIAIVGSITYFGGRYLLSDYYFQQSVLAINKNDAQGAYDNQRMAIQTFPYSDAYSRVFSQLNLGLANNLSMSVPKDSSPSAQLIQNIYGLVQQSINFARNATTIAPQTALNWQNLSLIYKNLIGFGNNADQFAILAAQQAIQLDPNNPQGYVNLGGIYYQIGQYDQAIQQFRVAVNLKPDFANAYYNLGHALEMKGDLKSALDQYLTVRTLVASQKENVDRINSEIDTLQKKIASTNTTTVTEETEAPAVSGEQEPLNLSTGSARLPSNLPPVKLSPPPLRSVTASPTTAPTTVPVEETGL